MQATFWGVRGSIATSGARFTRFGGNTTCVEITHGGARLILDAGTGLRGLGDKLLAESLAHKRPIEASFLFSHTHWDHIQGFPFFAPAFLPSTDLRLWGASNEDGDLEDALDRQMQPPSFPVPISAMSASKHFSPVHDGETVQIGPFEVTARLLDHPQGVFGYRIQAGTRVLCFATDNEQPSYSEIDPALLDLARGANLLIHDAQYTEAQYHGDIGPPRHGWGHSTYVAACQIASAAEVERLALFHHDPSHEDDTVDSIERDARDHFQNVFAARETLTVDV